MAHIPREVLVKNFGIPQQAFHDTPHGELFIFPTAVPGPLASDQRAAAGSLPPSPINFAFRTMDMPVTKSTKGGNVRIVDSNTFKITTTTMMPTTIPSTVRLTMVR